MKARDLGRRRRGTRAEWEIAWCILGPGAHDVVEFGRRTTRAVAAEVSVPAAKVAGVVPAAVPAVVG